MSVEVELKAPAPAGFEARLKAAGAKHLADHHQLDEMYDLLGEPLRCAGVTLRIRDEDGTLLLTYKSASKHSEVKAKEEIEFPVPEDMRAVLHGIGYSVTSTKEKSRSEYSLDELHVCLDRVTGLGDWVEFEYIGDPEQGRALILVAASQLGIPVASLTAKSYTQLLREKAKKPGSDK